MCRRPFIIRKDKPDAAIVPCGKCDVCLQRRAAQWAFRLGIQNMHSSCSLFTTLTYNDDFLTECDGGYALVKYDLQCFFKRLRKLTKQKISYYACGEYGGNTFRPHYHGIIFNATPEMVQDAWCLNGKSIGHTQFDVVNDATIRYVTGYICKSYGRKLSNHLPPEFAVMSKGIGLQYMNTAAYNFHAVGLNNFVTNGCVKIAMPRYFADRYFTAEQRKAFTDERVRKIAAGELRIISDVGIFQFLRDKQVDNAAAERSAKIRFDQRDYF